MNAFPRLEADEKTFFLKAAGEGGGDLICEGSFKPPLPAGECQCASMCALLCFLVQFGQLLLLQSWRGFTS